MSQKRPPKHGHGLRAWYAGKNPPDKELVELIDELDPEPTLLYDNADPEQGRYASVVKSLYDKMDTLKRTPAEFRPWSPEDGIETFLKALLDQGPADMRSRVRLLQELGSFHFRAGDGPQEKKAKIEAVFTEHENDDPRNVFASQARRLGAVWAPQKGTLLASIIKRPALAGRALADRLNPTQGAPLRWIGHPFSEARSTDLAPLADAKVVAYEQPGEIHLVEAVEPVLNQWDVDGAGSGCEQISLLEALLLHEVVEVVLAEEDPPLAPPVSHLVASTFERYLKGEMLHVAIEDYLLAWPPLSLEEQKERQEQELAEQVEAASAFFEEEEVPDFIEEDIDDLPMDDAPPPIKKKKKAPAKADAKGKKPAAAKKKIKKKRPSQQ